MTPAHTRNSRPIGECAEHHSRAKDAGASGSPIPLQPALQLSRHRVLVSFPRVHSAHPQLTKCSRRYLVVDLMTGGDLRFHISRKTFTEDAVRFWMAELACALRYIHGQGIVHRDLKPDNVLLDSEGHVHLADFVSLSSFRPIIQLWLMIGRTLHRISGLINRSTVNQGHSRTLLLRFTGVADILARWIGGLLGSLSMNAFSTRWVGPSPTECCIDCDTEAFLVTWP